MPLAVKLGEAEQAKRFYQAEYGWHNGVIGKNAGRRSITGLKEAEIGPIRKFGWIIWKNWSRTLPSEMCRRYSGLTLT